MSVCRYTCDVNRGPIPMSYDTIPDKISTKHPTGKYRQMIAR